jgi:hypothetical protein
MWERQVLLWAGAVRQLLASWEPMVAKFLQIGLDKQMTPPPLTWTTMAPGEMWLGETQRHQLLIAANNLLKAIKLMDHPPKVDLAVSKELTEVRDLNEHWVENMPIFNVRPRPRDPGYPSGKEFAKRYARHDPYCWWAWDGERGPLVSPNVSATQMHELVDAAVAAVVADRPDLVGSIEEAAPRP